ncbi:uncharacterized protein METZ01_LOCUS371953, partial [marine metagenome]
NVPYYRKIFNQCSFRPESIKDVLEIEKLPLLCKDDIKKNYYDFIDETANPDDLVYMASGGSTGNPLKVLMTKEFRSLNHASTHFYLNVAGFELGASQSIRLHGNTMPSEVLEKNEFWFEEGNRLTMSVYHVTLENCAAYVDAINSFSPVYIHAFPSALSLLVEYMCSLKLSFNPSIVAVFCDSETLYDWQRENISKVTKAKIFNTYGHTEGATIAITYPNSTKLDSIGAIGLVELIGEEGKTLSEKESLGEIVVTGFNNPVFPLIRYRTYDIATLSLPVDTGRPFVQFESINGRVQDYVVTKQ